MKSLKHTFHKLQEELMLLGIISFLLVATEEPFVDACIISTGTDGCSPTEAFFTYNAVHQIHLFLFVLSATHVIYSASSLVLCVISVRSHQPAFCTSTLSYNCMPLCPPLSYTCTPLCPLSIKKYPCAYCGKGPRNAPGIPL
jgi:hypothetical protein